VGPGTCGVSRSVSERGRRRVHGKKVARGYCRAIVLCVRGNPMGVPLTCRELTSPMTCGASGKMDPAAARRFSARGVPRINAYVSAWLAADEFVTPFRLAAQGTCRCNATFFGHYIHTWSTWTWHIRGSSDFFSNFLTSLLRRSKFHNFSDVHAA
jgi:hypothetical protein